jgi:hypothetical protein
MKKIIKKLKNQTGAVAILISVLIMTAILTVTMAASSIIQNGIIMGKTQVHSTKAYFAAEAGLERLLYEIRKGAFNVAGCSPGQYANLSLDQCQATQATTNLSNFALFNIENRDASLSFSTCPPNPPGTCSVSFYSLGEFEQVRRSVEIAY